MTITTGAATGQWTEVCSIDSLVPDRGAAALVEGDAVAIFRLSDCGADGGSEILAIDHTDPFHQVGALARGLVGSVGDRVVVASPLLKQRFDLRTGECLEDASMSVRAWDVEVIDGTVRVRRR
jgi:nitrite reductase (NADH) small subunit